MRETVSLSTVRAALRRLKQAQPAEISYLRDFRLDQDAPDYLPGMVSFLGECAGKCLLVEANWRRIPLSRFGDVGEIEIIDENEMIARTDFDETQFRIIARGDFNGDHLDDILIEVGIKWLESRYGGTELFVMTREAPDAVLYVLDAKRHLCSGYQCSRLSDNDVYFDLSPSELFSPIEYE